MFPDLIKKNLRTLQLRIMEMNFFFRKLANLSIRAKQKSALLQDKCYREPLYEYNEDNIIDFDYI